MISPKTNENPKTDLSPFQRDALEALPKRVHLLLDEPLHIRICDPRLPRSIRFFNNGP